MREIVRSMYWVCDIPTQSQTIARNQYLLHVYQNIVILLCLLEMAKSTEKQRKEWKLNREGQKEMRYTRY